MELKRRKDVESCIRGKGLYVGREQSIRDACEVRGAWRERALRAMMGVGIGGMAGLLLSLVNCLF